VFTPGMTWVEALCCFVRNYWLQRFDNRWLILASLSYLCAVYWFMYCQFYDTEIKPLPLRPRKNLFVKEII